MPLSNLRKYRYPSASSTPDLAAHISALAMDVDLDVANVAAQAAADTERVNHQVTADVARIGATVGDVVNQAATNARGLGETRALMESLDVPVLSATVKRADTNSAAAVARSTEAKDAATRAERLLGTAAVPTDGFVAALLPDSRPDKSQTRAALDGIYSTPEALDALRSRLDIWPAFNLLGGDADSWDASDYTKYLAGVDAMMGPAIAEGRVKRHQYGTGTGGHPLVRFTAGPASAPHMFLGGGMHGIELVANHAAMRFFQGFVYSDHPAMRALRTRIRISWVPSSNPTSYRYGRASSTGVDINRNFPWGWEYYPTDDINRYKGPAPLSEPESTALVNLFKAENFRLMFDCHCVGASAQPQFSIAPGGSWITTNRALPHGVLSRWAATYNWDGAVTYGELGDGNGGDPTFKTWAAKYMRYDRNHEDSFSMTVEASDRMHGSTATLTTRRALSSYCGYIALLLADWLEAGHLPPSPVVMSQYATTYTSPDAAVTPETSLDPAIGTTLADGGQWVNTNSLTPFPWQSVRGLTTASTLPKGRRTYVDVAIKNPGFLVAEVSGMFEASSTMKDDCLVEFAVAAGPAPAGGGNVSIKPESYRRIILPGALNHEGMSGVGTPFHTRVVIPFVRMPDTPLQRIQFMVRRTDGIRLHTFSVRRADMTVTLYPNTVTDPLPLVSRDN